MTDQNASAAAIQFALEADDGLNFLRLWNEGEFAKTRSGWPHAPEAVYIGADPLNSETRMTENADKDAQVSAMTNTLRTMRKHGFTIAQDHAGRAQSQSEQFRRAQCVAADMLRTPVDNSDGLLNNLAIEIIKVSNAAENLSQFNKGALSTSADASDGAVVASPPEGLTDEFLKEQWHMTIQVCAHTHGEVVMTTALRAFAFRVLQTFGDADGMHRAISENYTRTRAAESARTS